MGGEDEITCVSSFKVNTTFPGKVKHHPALSARTHTKGERREEQTTTPLHFFSASLPQCVSCRLSASCRCTAPAQGGGVCAGTAGHSSTPRRRASSWDTQSELMTAVAGKRSPVVELSVELHPISLDSNPQSKTVPVASLIQSLRKGPFTAVRPGTGNTPVAQATMDR